MRLFFRFSYHSKVTNDGSTLLVVLLLLFLLLLASARGEEVFLFFLGHLHTGKFVDHLAFVVGFLFLIFAVSSRTEKGLAAASGAYLQMVQGYR